MAIAPCNNNSFSFKDIAIEKLCGGNRLTELDVEVIIVDSSHVSLINSMRDPIPISYPIEFITSSSLVVMVFYVNTDLICSSF